jgi:hypothetical protein
VFTPHGCAREFFQPGSDFDVSFAGASLAPFDDAQRFGRSFKSNLLVIDGLDLAVGIEEGTVGHEASRVILTGSGARSQSPSLEQFLAVDCGLGADTPHTSLVLAVGNDRPDPGSSLSYSSLGMPLPKWTDPSFVFHELFGAPLTAQDRRESQQRRTRGQSVLDFVREDLRRLHSRTGRGDQAKFEQHHTALREIEKRLVAVEQRSTAHCITPGSPSATAAALSPLHGRERQFEQVTELLTDLMARAMACDLTRFATLMLADLSRTSLYPELPVDVHAEVAHRYMPKTPLGPGVAESWKLLALQNRHSYGHVARLLQRLDEASLLDDCLVYVTSDMGDPARHSSRNVPTLLAGGVRSGFELGRYVDLRAAKGAELLPHNRLLVSILRAFGVEQGHFGVGARHLTHGELSELRGAA